MPAESLKPHLDYEAKVVLRWEFNTNEDPQKYIKRVLEELSKDERLKTAVKNIWVKIKHVGKEKIALADYPPDDVLPLVRASDSKTVFNVDGIDYNVRMNSHRYFVFRNNRFCVSCGAEGTIMRLEKYSHDVNPHFNLYAIINGKAVLMTKDHIKSKATGGKDTLFNYQTMCAICNNLKGSFNIPARKLKELRKLYDDNLSLAETKAGKKQLADLINKHRETLIVPEIPLILTPGKTRIYTDIHVVANENGKLCAEQALAVDSRKHYVACIKKDTPIEIRNEVDNCLVVVVDDIKFKIHKFLTTWPN